MLLTGVEVEREAVVTGITTHATEGCTVLTAGGERYDVDCCIVTVPLGVLKAGAIRFAPALPPSKQAAIARIGMGAHNKVILRWHPKDVFWPPTTPQINCPDQRFQWLNLHAYGKAGCLLTHIFPPFAHGYDGMNDSTLVNTIVECLRGMFRLGSESDVPPPIDSVVTRWDTDPYSLGSYSFEAKSSLKGDVEALRAPCNHDRLFWAGEAAAEAGRQCVHGAALTGVQAAEEALEAPWRCRMEREGETFSSSLNAFDMLMGGGNADSSEDDDSD